MFQCELTRNASDQVTIETESYWLSWKINCLLMFKYRFRRKGRFILGLDEVIYHDFVKANLIINSGWDIWCGYDWSANCSEGNQFLIEFFERHLQR